MIPLQSAAIVRLGGPENQRAVSGPAASPALASLEAVSESLDLAKHAGARMAILVGGEPLMRKDLPKVLGAVLESSLALGMVTNGRLLLYPKLRRLLLRSKLQYLQVQLHGASAEAHDGLVGVPGAFQQAQEAIEALLLESNPARMVDVAFTITPQTLPHLLEKLQELTAFKRSSSLGVRFVCPRASDPSELWPDMESAIPVVNAALELVSGSATDITVTWEGFPPCLLDAHAHLRDETLRYGVPIFGSPDLSMTLFREEGPREHPFPCQECCYEATCPGVPDGYLEREGESNLLPTKAVRANSFNYEFQGVEEDFDIAAIQCPGPSRSGQLPLERSLFLERNQQIERYSSPSSDFTDAEIHRVKYANQQIYLDLAQGASLHDFQTDIRRLLPHERCPPCSQSKVCFGLYRVDPEVPFQREERWLRKEVSRLRGRVLDVGCGEQLYQDELRTLIEQGLVEYHGLEPDAAIVQTLKEQGPGGSYHQTGIEDFEYEAGYFDYILALRSVNHFHDMEAAFRVISRLLRPEGQMVLCDAPPFAVLRTPEQVEFADQNAPYGHEHFRNWTSWQLLEFLKRYPLRVDVHRPVNPQSSNQWILKYMRTSSDVAPSQPSSQ